MPRTLWNGSISFGLVNVPVALVPAVVDRDLHFRQLHEADGAPIEQVRVCAEEGTEVPFEEIGHGFELDDGRQVVLTDAELEAVAPGRTRTIDVQSFVDAGDVPPLLFDHPYWLVPSGAGEGGLRAYRLLVAVMERTGRAAIARFVLRTRERMALVRARDGRLECTTLRFGDELRPTDRIDTGATEIDEGCADTMVALVEELSESWDPSRYEDCFRSRLEAVIERKQAGETISAPKPEAAPKAAPDLMAALKASLDAARGRERGPRDDGGHLERMTKEELLEQARAADLSGRSKMTKDELVEALSSR
jgi:DNA end-binding protein Ku